MQDEAAMPLPALILPLILGLLPPATAARPRRADPRTGRAAPSIADLAAAVKRGDRAEIERVAERLGLARLRAALDTGEAAAPEILAALPLLPGGVLMCESVVSRLESRDAALAEAAALSLGRLLAVGPVECEVWDVPPDAIAAACDGLRKLAARSDGSEAAREAAREALAEGAALCREPAGKKPPPAK